MMAKRLYQHGGAKPMGSVKKGDPNFLNQNALACDEVVLGRTEVGKKVGKKVSKNLGTDLGGQHDSDSILLALNAGLGIELVDEPTVTSARTLSAVDQAQRAGRGYEYKNDAGQFSSPISTPASTGPTFKKFAPTAQMLVDDHREELTTLDAHQMSAPEFNWYYFAVPLLGFSVGLMDSDPDDYLPMMPSLSLSDLDNDQLISASGRAQANTSVQLTWPDGSTSVVMTSSAGHYEIESSSIQGYGQVVAFAIDTEGRQSHERTAFYAGVL